MVDRNTLLSTPDETDVRVRFFVVIIQNAPADPLSDVLAGAGFNAACSVRLTAGGDWALRFRPIALKFNAVLHGGCWLTPEGEAAARLDAGDCFIVAGRPFVLSSAPGLPTVDAAEVFAGSPFCATYGLGDDVALLGGSVAFAGADASHLLDLLPSSLVIRNEADGAAMMGWLLNQLDREWREDRPGAQAACDDLLRLMFIQALREHLSTADADALGWLAGLKDPPVAAALKAIHAEPTRAWRLPELAARAGLSRTAFAERFRARVGRPPVEYAATWRMRFAARRLREGRKPVSVVAHELGFLSDSAFGAAFRRVHGVSPGRYRVAARRAAPLAAGETGPTSSRSDRTRAGADRRP